MKPVRLAITNAAEDLPRLIHGSGKCAHGSFAIVLRPLQGEGLLGLITNDNEGFVWRGGPRLDAPGVPREAIAPEALIQAVQAAQKKLGAQGAVSLRAQWSATFVCDDLTPSVVLTRKVSAYATLTVQSGPQGWTWRVARSAKWFTPEGDATGEALRLSDAVASGLAAAMGLVKEACVVRDTQRRAPLDAEYAVQHPLKLAAEPKSDPLARFKPPKGQARPGRPPKSVEAPGGAPAPTTATAVEAKAAEVKEEADGLDAALNGVSPLWAENDAPERIVRWLTDQGLYGLAELVAEGPQAQGFEGWIELLHERALAETPAALTQAVRDVLDGLKTAWETYPALFERARCLLRTAANLASSAPCQGPERAEAIRLVNEAAAEYERARAQLFTTSDATTRRMLRQAVSRAALGAAKAAKACAKAPKVTRQPGVSREAERLLKAWPRPPRCSARGRPALSASSGCFRRSATSACPSTASTARSATASSR
ncbi:MAG: hypothetical protein IPN01_24415 [Deltaproteobacteria bacterium]|nr:hypothetical protein [Deltaproteobacteria bacterium]